VPCGTRAPLGAPHTHEIAHVICGVFTPASGPALVRPVALKCAGRAFSQLLTGARSGPGGCPDAARVSGLRSRTRGRRTSSRRHDGS
jgi:hypothetical protein